MNVCSVEDCEKSVVARGWCRTHYSRWWKNGHLRVRRGEACSVAECERSHYSRGWCIRHYSSWRRHGDPLTARRHFVGLPPEERFWFYVDAEGSCWEWTGGRHQGYGYFAVGEIRAHRFSWELLVGPIPEGLVLDHLCQVRHCVNPDHLEPVTQAENNRRARIAKVA